MGLRKRIICGNQKKTRTKEDLEKQELAWKIFCEKGEVCINDPLRPVESVMNVLKRNPDAFTGPFSDYHGDIPLNELRQAAIKEREETRHGSYDEK